jgi:hypothetical protein
MSEFSLAKNEPGGNINEGINQNRVELKSSTTCVERRFHHDHRKESAMGRIQAR